jgi:mannose/fructose/N-acetylgalactosamine-specific phosphotransferase system component IIB
MPIVLVRVDERLIHGQILQAWIPSIRADELFVANDLLAQDATQKRILEAAVPLSVRLTIDTIDGVARVLIDNRTLDRRRMVIVENPIDALRLRRSGVEFDLLNVGNYMAAEVALFVSPTVRLGKDSFTALRDITLEGVRVSIQTVPYDKPVDFFRVCGNFVDFDS